MTSPITVISVSPRCSAKIARPNTNSLTLRQRQDIIVRDNVRGPSRSSAGAGGRAEVDGWKVAQHILITLFYKRPYTRDIVRMCRVYLRARVCTRFAHSAAAIRRPNDVVVCVCGAPRVSPTLWAPKTRLRVFSI